MKKQSWRDELAKKIEVMSEINIDANIDRQPLRYWAAPAVILDWSPKYRVKIIYGDKP
jgi:hypothetical protein